MRHLDLRRPGVPTAHDSLAKLLVRSAKSRSACILDETVQEFERTLDFAMQPVFSPGRRLRRRHSSLSSLSMRTGTSSGSQSDLVHSLALLSITTLPIKSWSKPTI